MRSGIDFPLTMSNRAVVGAIQELKISSTNAYRIPIFYMPYAAHSPYRIPIFTDTVNGYLLYFPRPMASMTSAISFVFTLCAGT